MGTWNNSCKGALADDCLSGNVADVDVRSFDRYAEQSQRQVKSRPVRNFGEFQGD
jgi:hypothetical protein